MRRSSTARSQSWLVYATVDELVGVRHCEPTTMKGAERYNDIAKNNMQYLRARQGLDSFFNHLRPTMTHCRYGHLTITVPQPPSPRQ